MAKERIKDAQNEFEGEYDDTTKKIKITRLKNMTGREMHDYYLDIFAKLKNLKKSKKIK